MIYLLIDEVNEIKNKEKEKNKNNDIILELTKKNEEYKNRVNNLENRIKKLEEEINNYKQFINKIIKEDVKKKDNNNIIINDGNQRENFKEIKDFSINQEVKLENEPQDDYELLIYIKDDQLLVYNSKYTFFKLKINLEYIKATFKSRYVNLGKSILLTGGIIRETELSKKCYLISLIENDLPNKPFYDININPYGDFQEWRERHNLIYLPDKNLVFACGGIISKTCEYTNIYKGYWESVSPLNKSRANASMAYINGRYIYIIGGFELKFGERLGNYLNNLEYFDIRDFKKGWKEINFKNSHKYDLSLTAMGVVQIAKNSFLICGGYDGKVYKEDVYIIDCSDYENPLVKKDNMINNETIFTHNMFCKINNNYFNFDFQGQLYEFDSTKQRFGFLNMDKFEENN